MDIYVREVLKYGLLTLVGILVTVGLIYAMVLKVDTEVETELEAENGDAFVVLNGTTTEVNGTTHFNGTVEEAYEHGVNGWLFLLLPILIIGFFTVIGIIISLMELCYFIRNRYDNIKNIKDVFFANACRAKESLRVLEEVSKLYGNGSSEKFKKLRFRTYELEKKSSIKLEAVLHNR